MVNYACAFSNLVLRAFPYNNGKSPGDEVDRGDQEKGPGVPEQAFFLDQNHRSPKRNMRVCMGNKEFET